MSAFVSKDGTDNNGVRAEVYVQTGTGVVSKIEENGRNAKIEFKAEHLRRPVHGWIDKSDPVFAMLAAAKDADREVQYRVEAQRKRNVDRTTPIADLRATTDIAKENVMNIIAGCDGTLSREAVTNPAEDPNGNRVAATDADRAPRGGAAPATGGGFSVEQALAGLTAARQGGLPESIVDTAAALALAAGATVEQVMAAGVESQEDAQRREVRRVHAREAAPYLAFNTDARVNLGSFAVQAAVGAESLATELMAANAQAVVDAHNAAVAAGEAEGPEMDEPGPVNHENAGALALVLLDLADQIQVATYGGGRPDRMANSHTRARGYVYDAVKGRFPVPFGADEEVRAQWIQDVVAEGTARFQNAVRIAMDVQQDAPAQAAPDQGEQAQGEQAQGEQGQAAPDQGEQAQAQAQVQQGEQDQGGRSDSPNPMKEGDEGFVAPDADTLRSFAGLATAAGFEATPDSPVLDFLEAKFGVRVARKVHGPNLVSLLNWYSNQGPDGVEKFKAHVYAVSPGNQAKSA